MSWNKQSPRFAAAIFMFYKVISAFPFKLVTNRYGKMIVHGSRPFRLLSVISATLFFIFLPFINYKRILTYEEVYNEVLLIITIRSEFMLTYVKLMSYYFIIIFKYKACIKILNGIVLFYELNYYFDRKNSAIAILFVKIFTIDPIVTAFIVYFDIDFYTKQMSYTKVFENILDIHSRVLLLNTSNIFVTILLSSASTFNEINKQINRQLDSKQKNTIFKEIEFWCILQANIYEIINNVFKLFGFTILVDNLYQFIAILSEVCI